MLSRVAVNLVLVAGLLVGYGALASEATGMQYCLGGQLAQTLPDHAQTLVCTQSSLRAPSMPHLHWSALLPG